MDSTNCTALLEFAEKTFLCAECITDELALQIHTCLPEACPQIYGSAAFDLAGTGVYYSTLIQVALFVLCGPFQALVSRCLSPSASTRTKLSLARFQSVLDTAYSTSTLLACGITVAGFVRTSAGNSVAALERSMVRDMSNLQAMAQNLALASYVIMATPTKINRGSRAWSPVGVYLCCQVLNVATWYLKRRIDAIPSMKIIQKLCSDENFNFLLNGGATKGFPDLNTSQAPSWNPFVTGAALGILVLILGTLLSIFLPKVCKFIEGILTGRIVKTFVAVLWISGCLLCTWAETYRLSSTRNGLKGTPAWDVGQIFVVMIWAPTVVKLGLTVLMALTVKQVGFEETRGARVARIASSIVEGLYESWYGTEPCVEEDPADMKYTDRNEINSVPMQSAQADISDEKVALFGGSDRAKDENTGRDASPGAQV